MSASVIDFPAAEGSAAGQGRSPASQPSRGVGDPQPITKRGRDIQVGDQMVHGREVFLVIGFTPTVTRFGRVAVNVWGETAPINDRHHRLVLKPAELGDHYPAEVSERPGEVNRRTVGDQPIPGRKADR